MKLELAAVDLLAWTQAMLVDGELARCELKALRYKLLHVAARLARGQHRTYLWRWAGQLAAAFAALRRLPVPIPTG